MPWPWKPWPSGKKEETGRQVLCRHCSLPFQERRIGVVCTSERCGRVEDDRGRPAPRFFFAADRGMWGPDGLELAERCPFCQERGTLTTACPHCRRPLQHEDGQDHVIAVIGATASGKSHFLSTVLYQLLDAEVGEDVWEVDLDRREKQRFREKLIDPLFEELHTLPSTVDRVDEELLLPLVNRRDGRRVLLVFRDLGGEIFQQPERLARMGFLRYAQGVVLMADPLAFGSANGQGPPDARRILEMYGRVMGRLGPELAGLETADLDSLPLLPEQKFLALAVTKADLVLGTASPLWGGDGPSYLERGFWARREEQSRAVNAWIEKELGPELLDEASAFAEVSSFMVSSFGYRLDPGETRLRRPPAPRRVHEPIFALIDRLTGHQAEESAEEEAREEPDAYGEAEPWVEAEAEAGAEAEAAYDAGFTAGASEGASGPTDARSKRGAGRNRERPPPAPKPKPEPDWGDDL